MSKILWPWGLHGATMVATQGSGWGPGGSGPGPGRARTRVLGPRVGQDRPGTPKIVILGQNRPSQEGQNPTSKTSLFRPWGRAKNAFSGDKSVFRYSLFGEKWRKYVFDKSTGILGICPKTTFLGIPGRPQKATFLALPGPSREAPKSDFLALPGHPAEAWRPRSPRQRPGGPTRSSAIKACDAN